MIKKTKSSSFRQLFSYIVGGDPVDEWEFHVESHACRVVNGWRSGAALFVDGNRKVWNEEMFAVRGEKPMLTADIETAHSGSRRIDVYVRAIVGVKIQVRVDGVPIIQEFI